MNLISIPPESIKHKNLVAIPHGLYTKFQKWCELQEHWEAVKKSENSIVFTAKQLGESHKFLSSLMRKR